MSEDRRFRLVLFFGAIGGAILAVVVSLLLDVLYADALGGTWRDAIANDMQTFFSITLSPNGFVVTVLFVITLGILGLFGALMGSIFSLFVFKFIELLTREGKPPGEEL